MFRLHLRGRGHGCPRGCTGEEGSELPPKLFAASNTGSFHRTMAETTLSFTLTNKPLTVAKNDPIIYGKKNNALNLKVKYIGRRRTRAK